MLAFLLVGLSGLYVVGRGRSYLEAFTRFFSSGLLLRLRSRA